MLHLFRKKKKKSLAEIFHHIYYKTDWWKSTETGSGPGSSLDNTRRIREQIPALLQSFHIHSLLDAPCGDLNWVSHMNLGDIAYTGADIVEQLVAENRKKFPGRAFLVADITKDPLPGADAVLCRDCFIHLPNELVMAAITNFKRSGIPYLLTNTYDFIQENKDIEAGGFRMINLQLPPFSLPAPLAGIQEEYTSGYPDKKLAIWKLS